MFDIIYINKFPYSKVNSRYSRKYSYIEKVLIFDAEADI